MLLIHRVLVSVYASVAHGGSGAAYVQQAIKLISTNIFLDGYAPATPDQTPAYMYLNCSFG